jgi:DNA ligase-associated metallophosphoesterase
MSLIVNGAALEPDLSGALWWPDRATLVVADLHLEKGSSLAGKGTLLPPYDTAETLSRLAATMARRAPERVIALGDSFHDSDAGARLSVEDGITLADLVRRVDWTWIVGNHDPHPHGPWGGTVRDELVLGPLVFRHQAAAGPAPGEISGHFHPKAAIVVRARRVSGRCFVADGRRTILPAFGAFAGGLDAGAPAIARLFPGVYWAHLVGRQRIVAVPHDRLIKSWF